MLVLTVHALTLVAWEQHILASYGKGCMDSAVYRTDAIDRDTTI